MFSGRCVSEGLAGAGSVRPVRCTWDLDPHVLLPPFHGTENHVCAACPSGWQLLGRNLLGKTTPFQESSFPLQLGSFGDAPR